MEQSQTVYRLRSCVWELTLACCFSCRYCGSGGGRARPDELSRAECLRVADELAALGCERVSLIGGEVFLRPDWAEITARLTGQGVRAAVITNGALFTDELLKQVKAAGVESVAVSLDGPEAVHDRYRQAGSYRRAEQAVFRLARAGIPVSLITTLNAENAACLPEFYRTVRGWPLAAWQLQACSPMGNAAKSGVNYCFDAAAVLDFVRENAPAAPFLLGVADNIGYFGPGEGSLRGRLDGCAPFGGCRAGLSAIGIDSAGNVRGCESMYDDAFIEGNLRERSLRAIWEDPAAFAYNRQFTPERLTGPCRTCAFGRRCAGGCRSYNYFVHGKLYESPHCVRRDGPPRPAQEAFP